jgi:hypothetical protein
VKVDIEEERIVAKEAESDLENRIYEIKNSDY